MKFVWEANEEEAESIVLLIYALWWYFNDRWKRGSKVRQKIYLEPAELYLFRAGILAEAISMTNSGMLYRVDISTWDIAVSYFCHLEIYKNLGLPLPTITFTINSHTDNYFCKNIYLFQKLCSMKSFFFLLKYPLKFVISKFDLNVKHYSYFF